VTSQVTVMKLKMKWWSTRSWQRSDNAVFITITRLWSWIKLICLNCNNTTDTTLDYINKYEQKLKRKNHIDLHYTQNVLNIMKPTDITVWEWSLFIWRSTRLSCSDIQVASLTPNWMLRHGSAGLYALRIRYLLVNGWPKQGVERIVMAVLCVSNNILLWLGWVWLYYLEIRWIFMQVNIYYL
jgi:hypothetical protein